MANVIVQDVPSKWDSRWDDRGTGGHDYGFFRALSSPSGYIPLGDAYNRSHEYPSKMAFIKTTDPKFAIPATDFTSVAKFRGEYDNWKYFYAWRPICSNPNYKAIGLLISSSKPSPGSAYCINIAYLEPFSLTASAPKVDVDGNMQKNGIQFYSSFSGLSSIFTETRNMYNIRTDNAVMTCCTTNGKCSDLQPGSNLCVTQFMNNCSTNGNLDPLKTDGTCKTWCQNDPVGCDIVKTQYCTNNTTDPWCKCINRSDNGSTQFLINKNSTLPLVCKLPACTNARPGIDTFMLSTDMATLPQCAVSQQINANIIQDSAGAQVSYNASNTSTQIPYANTPDIPPPRPQPSPQPQPQSSSPSSQTQSPSPSPSPMWVVLILFIIFVIIAIMTYFKTPKSETVTSTQN